MRLCDHVRRTVSYCRNIVMLISGLSQFRQNCTCDKLDNERSLLVVIDVLLDVPSSHSNEHFRKLTKETNKRERVDLAFRKINIIRKCSES